jgi:hypothetical protein
LIDDLFEHIHIKPIKSGGVNFYSDIDSPKSSKKIYKLPSRPLPTCSANSSAG